MKIECNPLFRLFSPEDALLPLPLVRLCPIALADGEHFEGQLLQGELPSPQPQPEPHLRSARQAQVVLCHAKKIVFLLFSMEIIFFQVRFTHKIITNRTPYPQCPTGTSRPLSCKILFCFCIKNLYENRNNFFSKYILNKYTKFELHLCNARQAQVN